MTIPTPDILIWRTVTDDHIHAVLPQKGNSIFAVLERRYIPGSMGWPPVWYVTIDRKNGPKFGFAFFQNLSEAKEGVYRLYALNFPESDPDPDTIPEPSDLVAPVNTVAASPGPEPSGDRRAPDKSTPTPPRNLEVNLKYWQYHARCQRENSNHYLSLLQEIRRIVPTDTFDTLPASVEACIRCASDPVPTDAPDPEPVLTPSLMWENLNDFTHIARILRLDVSDTPGSVFAIADFARPGSAWTATILSTTQQFSGYSLSTAKKLVEDTFALHAKTL